MKSVLFINRVYPPDEGATGQLLAELATALARDGWRVTIVAAGAGTVSDVPSPNISVQRVRGLPFTRAALWKRALAYASLYPALFWRVLRLPRHDVVVTLTDPPLMLLLGPWLKWIKRARLVHWAQDVYPEVAEELGVVRRGGLAVRLLRQLSTWALRRHDAVITVGRCMKERFLARGLDENKLIVIPNWPLTASGAQRSTLNAQLPFTVMYSGNFGLAHPFEAIIEAVKILDRESASVRFVFAGSGPKLAALRGQLADCANVEFRGPAPLEELSARLSAADAHLASMTEALCGLVVPSKVYGVLAAGRPCVFLGPRASEAAQLILESGAGTVLSVGDGNALAELLRCWSARGAEYQRVRAASERWAAARPSGPWTFFSRVLAGEK